MYGTDMKDFQTYVDVGAPTDLGLRVRCPTQDGFADMKLSSTSLPFRDDVFWKFVFNHLLL